MFYFLTQQTIYAMKKKVAMRKYKFSDAFLKQYAEHLLSSIRRDKIEFEDRGFNANKEVDFEKLISRFAEFPSDEQLEAIKIAATETKNQFRLVLEKALRTVFLMAKNVFKEGTGKYKEFGNGNLTKFSDEELVRNAKTTEIAAQKYLAELSDEGFSANKLNELVKAREKFDAAIDEKNQAICNRDISTESRIETGNALYELVAKYANVGKDIWYDTNEAKYNDYLIYDIPNDSSKGENPNEDLNL